MTDAELNALITSFRQETEDLTKALVREIFNIQYNEVAVPTGPTGASESFTTAYDSIDDYEVRILSALDADGTNIADAVTVTKVSASGFTLTTERAGTVRWQSSRRLPKIDFFTV